MEKAELYQSLYAQIQALLEGEHDLIANMANISACLYHTLPQINWSGFYLVKDHDLILGPFQGKPACMHIPYGKGVCGTCVKENCTQLVKDVHQFPGHIACDDASRSEIVIPVNVNSQMIAVLDIDAPIPSGFDDVDALWLKRIVSLLVVSVTI